jgi:hypothetical protein
MKKKKLTPKQEKFAQNVAKGMSKKMQQLLLGIVRKMQLKLGMYYPVKKTL